MIETVKKEKATGAPIRSVLRESLRISAVACLCLLAAFSGVFGGAQASGQTPLPQPWQQRSFAEGFTVGRTFPIVSNGYLLSHKRTIKSGSSGSIFLTSLQTGEQQVLPFWRKDALKIRVEAGAFTPGGHVLLGGSNLRSQDGTDSVNFVAEVDRSGKLVAWDDLSDYTPERICAAPDGSFWTLGQVWSKEYSKDDYFLLRHYSGAGALISAHFPRSALPSGVTIDYHARYPQVNIAFLSCGDFSVAAYVGSGTPPSQNVQPRFVWFEVDMITGETRMWAVRNPNHGGTITGMVLSSDQTAYASFYPGGLYRLVAGPADSGVWESVPVEATSVPSTSSSQVPSEAFGVLLGRDGQSLVHIRGVEAPVANAVVYWSRPSSR